MKKNHFLFVIFSIFFTGNALFTLAQSDESQIAYRVTEKDLIPEGITYSSITNSFYISSIHKTKIVKIDSETGEFNDFIASDLFAMRYLGMIADDSNNRLWSCGNMSKNGKEYSIVAVFNLSSGELIKSYINIDSVANIYNDLVQDTNNKIYFTNTNKQTIYLIEPQADSVEIFFDDEQILHPNGITISPDNKYLYIASEDHGIRVLDIDKRKIIDEPDSTINSKGIDGLKYYKNSLIGIQNEVKHRSDVKIAQYYLHETGTKITSMKVIDQNNPYFDIPTTFVIVSDQLYCIANSQMGNINFSTNEIHSYEALDDIIILRYGL